MSTITKPCDTCHQGTHYEPILCGSTDLSASLPHHCAECTHKANLAASQLKKQQLQAKRELDVERVIAAKLRATDITHPTFNHRAWNALSRWTPDTGKWLVLLGETGLSKSRISALLAMRAIRSGLRVEWTTAQSFKWAATREFDDDIHTRTQARQWLRKWKSAALLVFDDFGKAGFSPSVEAHIFDLVDHRQSYYLPMIISCNTHPRDMIASQMLSQDRGAPIVARILESAGNVIKLKTPPQNTNV